MTLTIDTTDTATRHRTTCPRCGQDLNPDLMSKRRFRNDENELCIDCSRKPAESIKYGDLKCTPWSGEVDLDTMQPMKDGKPYMVGARICGHADCVARSHVLTFENLLAEQFSMFYRTGVRQTYQQLIAMLEEERRSITRRAERHRRSAA